MALLRPEAETILELRIKAMLNPYLDQEGYLQSFDSDNIDASILSFSF